LYFFYWIDNLGFITEGKLAAIFIKPSLGISNWSVILLHQQTQSSFLASSSPRHQRPTTIPITLCITVPLPASFSVLQSSPQLRLEPPPSI
jgi:hypothetical protein